MKHKFHVTYELGKWWIHLNADKAIPADQILMDVRTKPKQEDTPLYGEIVQVYGVPLEDIAGLDSRTRSTLGIGLNRRINDQPYNSFRLRCEAGSNVPTFVSKEQKQ